ncbi:phosphatase PAP2 family protein [Algoriphagus kandeliae]|uniref:Phosphatase PAP2 family protein n=1 Tax=Algoriphagus kandeliae TaxID=2562278 RepID=A0A4Y9QSY0_9BACT|nr:vanadium-dependent haloperoxidase [Algoriphagus kandeliae]TFV94243.1 phosphatase PAP2 family protein [Algoriphagus kandeliae]
MRISLFIFVFLLGFQVNTWAGKKSENWPSIYKNQLFHLTEVMVTDVASPPVAARIYAYSCLATYLMIKQQEAEFSQADFLPASLLEIDFTNESKKLNSPEFAAIYAMLRVGEKLMPSGYLLKEKQEIWIEKGIKNKWLKKSELEEHISEAERTSSLVLEIARKDGYLELPALTRYSPVEEEGRWYPTPPAYIEAVEPEWRTMQPFFIENLNSYSPAPMAPFSLEQGSSFYQQLMEVYETGKSLTEEQKLIANFWDCNPFMVEFSGHMAIGVKKISPGGHWMGITGIASEKANLNFAETAYIHALVGMTLHDAFISCWKAKYETDRIRPETVINQKIDQRWRPLLQTPPFPEYTSGHSVISRASAVILTGYFGDYFDFVDDSETYFGLPEREFPSFLNASEEAAISRLYGGIHFRDAIEEGVKQGEKIGKMIWEKITQKEILIPSSK